MSRFLPIKALIFAGLLLAGLGAMASPVKAEPEARGPVSIFYLGRDPAVRLRVFMDQDFKAVDSPEAAQVIVIHNESPAPELRSRIINSVREGKGLLLMLGPEIKADFLSELYGGTVELEPRNTPLAASFYRSTPGFWKGLWNFIRGRKPESDVHWSQAGHLDWSSLPSLAERSAPRSAAPLGKILLLGEKEKEGVLFEGSVGKGRVYLLTAWISVDPNAALARTENKNYQLLVWPFFNYLVYGVVMEAAGRAPLDFSRWPGSPVLRPRERNIIGIFLAGLIAANLIVFFLVVRYSRRHQTPLAGFSRAVYTHDTFDLKSSRQENHWQDAGFYRPLSGFLINLIMTIPSNAIAIPLGLWVMNHILIFPMNLGIDNLVWGVVAVLFFVFDLGLSDAAIKFYSEYRVKDPEKAVQFFQFLNWWQILSGLGQVLLITLVAFYFLPRTYWAYLAVVFICYSSIQWPGFTGSFFKMIFQAFQRFDYLYYIIFINFVVQSFLYVLVMYTWRKWGLDHPRFGEAFALFFGVFTFFLSLQTTLFIFGYLFYRRLGYPLRVMFMFHVKWEVAKEAVLYGYKLTIRKIIDKLDTFLWAAILSLILSNYLEISGIIGMALAAMGYFSLLDSLHESIFPSLAEAYSQGKMKLARHYIVQSIHWGFFGSVMICFVLVIIVGPLASLLNPQWQKVGAILPLIFLSSTLHFFAQMPDSVFKASGRTEFIPLVGVILLVVKVLFLFLLVPSLQVFGPPVVLIIVNLTDVAISWLLIRKYVLRLSINPFRMALPHLLAGIIITLPLLGIKALLLPHGTVGVTALIVMSIIMIVPYILLTALLGGWNEVNVDEFERAALANRLVKSLWYNAVRIIQFGRRHRRRREYPPEDAAELQAEVDQIVVARIPRDMRDMATQTLSTMGGWRKSLTMKPLTIQKADDLTE